MPSIAQTAAYTNTGSASSYNTGSQSIGAADSNRTIFALIASRGGASSVSSVTIGGVTASLVAASGAGVNAVASIYKIQASQLGDPQATTATVVVNFNAAVTRGVAIILAVTYDSIVAGATATAQDTVQDTAQEIVDVSLNVPANGFVIGVGCAYSEASGCTWTGITGGTEYQVSPTSAETYVVPGYLSNAAAASPLSVTFSTPVVAIGDVGSTTATAASFGPAATPRFRAKIIC